MLSLFYLFIYFFGNDNIILVGIVDIDTGLSDGCKWKSSVIEHSFLWIIQLKKSSWKAMVAVSGSNTQNIHNCIYYSYQHKVTFPRGSCDVDIDASLKVLYDFEPPDPAKCKLVKLLEAVFSIVKTTLLYSPFFLFSVVTTFFISNFLVL